MQSFSGSSSMNDINDYRNFVLIERVYQAGCGITTKECSILSAERYSRIQRIAKTIKR
jgi:hypothetical protein